MIASQIVLLYVITLILALFGLYISSRISSETSYLRKLFLFNFLIRIFLIFTLFLVLPKVLPETIPYLGVGDEFTYDRFGNAIAQAWRKGHNPEVSVPAPGFTYLNAIIFFLFGHNVLIVRIFNSFIGAWIPIFTYMIAKYAYGEDKIAKTSSILVSFLPSLLLHSITQLKEVPIIFTITFVIWMLMEGKKKFNVFLLLAIILACEYLLLLRMHYGLVLLISAVTYMIISYPREESPIKVVLFSMLVILSVWLMYAKLGYGLLGFDLVNNLSNYMFRYKYAVGSSNIFYSAFMSGGKIVLIPLVLMYSLLMPHPLWLFINRSYVVNSFSSWFDLIGAVAWYALIPFSAYGFFSSLKNRNSEKLLLCLFSFSIIFLLAISGQGLTTAGRHKDSIMPFLMIFAGVGIIDYIRGNLNIHLPLLLYAALLYGSSLLYIYMKLSSRMIQPFIIITGCTLAVLVFLTILKDRI